jgi:hypothetical protein
VYIHKSCLGDVAADCKGGGSHITDEAPEGKGGVVLLVVDEKSLRGFLFVNGSRVWGVLGRETLWIFAGEPKDLSQAAPQSCVSLAGVTLREGGLDKVVVVSVDNAETSLGGLSKEWIAALSGVVAHASERFFAAKVWAEAKLEPGFVLGPATEESLLERVLLRRERVCRQVDVIDADCLDVPFVVRVLGCSVQRKAAITDSFVVSLSVITGGLVLPGSPAVSTAATAPGPTCWNQWLLVSSRISSLNASAVILFTLLRSGVAEHVHLPLCDEAGVMRHGPVSLRLFPGQGSKFQFDLGDPPIAHDTGDVLHVWLGPPTSPRAPVVFRSGRHAELLENLLPVVEWDDVGMDFIQSHTLARTSVVSSDAPRSSSRGRSLLATEEVRCAIETISPEQRLLEWATKDAKDPFSVGRALDACDLTDPEHRRELSSFLEEVVAHDTRLHRPIAFELLLHTQASSLVRRLAVRHLFGWNKETAMVSLSTVSVLAFSPHDCNSAAIEYLRYLTTPRRVSLPGETHNHYWSMFSLAQQESCIGPRFSLYLRLFVQLLDKSVGTFLSVSGAFVCALNSLSRDDARHNKSLSDLARSHLAVLHRGPFVLPTSQNKVGPLDLTRSKVLSSNARPLMLRFPPLDSSAAEQTLIWKAGDDLATDELVMTLGAAMNLIWASENLSAFIVTYKVKKGSKTNKTKQTNKKQVSPTGHRVGAIEMVPDCTSLGKIQGLELFLLLLLLLFLKMKQKEIGRWVDCDD